VGRWAADPYVGFRPAADAGGGDPRVDWVDAPGGQVWLGHDTEPAAWDDALPDELPLHVVELASFEIARTPVTNAQYAAFVAETGHRPPPHWSEGGAAAADDVPVTWVDWHDARHRFPWGEDGDPRDRALVGLDPKRGAPGPVEARPRGAAACGAVDMAGNVWEWVSSLYRPYPYEATDGREDPAATGERVLRGGSFASPGLRWARCAFRSRSHPCRRQAHIGFRPTR
jgi:formylglycine-generating enzyme required for sulfatase activity